MNILDIHVYFFIISLLFLNVVDTQAASGESSHLFGSLSQLELLWYNDKHVVKIMETLLEDSFIDYRPLKRYACYLTIFVTGNKIIITIRSWLILCLCLQVCDTTLPIWTQSNS